MTPVLETVKLGKRYGRHHTITDCDLHVPPGRVIGLVGPNGAGKSTLLQLACGLITPSSGTIRVLGDTPAAGPAHLAKVGFVAQDTPVYADLSVSDHLRMGARLNPGWDQALARRRLARIDLDPRQKAGRLSGGQRAQLALTIAAAKRPELLIRPRRDPGSAASPRRARHGRHPGGLRRPPDRRPDPDPPALRSTGTHLRATHRRTDRPPDEDRHLRRHRRPAHPRRPLGRRDQPDPRLRGEGGRPHHLVPGLHGPQLALRTADLPGQGQHPR
ncbi:ABC transporter ATP-binding protein [Streptomyces sp. ISL-86]|nr:ABC transporter ATP-binding protein [Streptomyces sp. ISL-86]